MSADSDRKTTRIHVLSAVVGVAAAAVVLTACSGAEDTTGSTTSPSVATVSLPPFTAPSVQSWPGR